MHPKSSWSYLGEVLREAGGGGRVKPAETNLQTNRVIRKPDFTVMLITNVTLQETVIFREICSISDFSGMLAENVAVLE
jgi:hypothetical protein